MTLKDIFNFISRQTKADMLKCGAFYNVPGLSHKQTKADIIAAIEVTLIERHANGIPLKG